MAQRIDADSLIAFLEHLAETSHVAEAARHAGLSSSAIYRLKKDNAKFRAAWRLALEQGYEALEMEMLHRARFGVEKPLKSPNKTSAKNRNDDDMPIIREYNDALGLRLLTAHKQEVEKAREGRGDGQSAKQLLHDKLLELKAMAGKAENSGA